MKLKLLIGIVLLFIIGCGQIVEQQETQKETREVYARCHIGYFVIEPVDELIPSNCYAFRNNVDMKSYEIHILNKSLQYAGKDAHTIMQEIEPNRVCDYITPENFGKDVYCLKDSSSCLIVEDNKICNIINLK